MSNPAPSTTTTPGRSWRHKWRALLTTSALVVVVSSVVVSQACFPSHPRFGPIYYVTARELDNQPGRSGFAEFLRKNLPRRVVQSRFFPQQYKNDLARFVDLGDAQLYWSVGGTNSGWLYFWGADPRGGIALDKWEFAPSAETDLNRVFEFPTTFYSSTNLQLTNVFRESASTNAIKVTDGQIVFARWLAEPKLRFVFRFGERFDDKVKVTYCIDDQR